MAISFEISTVIPAAPQEVYKAWLDSKQHGLMTGARAKVNAKVSGKFESWDGYITGKNLKLETNKRIVQAWRTSEFSEDEDNSLLEIGFAKTKEGTKLTIKHSNLPEHGMQYKQGWVDSYFEPMKDYFKK
jgi:activator of HSP90 ATPase